MGEDEEGTFALFIVRMVGSNDLVGLFAAHDEAHLYEIVDECCEALCTEYRPIDHFALYWPDPAFAVPIDWEAHPEHIETYTNDAMLSEDAYGELSKGGAWRTFRGGSVYIVEAGGRYKIGYSADVTARVQGLQTACPFPLRLVATMPGTIDDEKRYHRHFAAYRKTGEWFELPADVFAALQSNGWSII